MHITVWFGGENRTMSDEIKGALAGAWGNLSL